MLSKLDKIRNTLLTVTENVGHYEAFKKTDQYIVWAEDSESGSLEADNQKKQQAIQGTIDYFTKMDGDPNVEAIQRALKENRISFRFNSVQYEEETELIHYEWVWEM